MSRTVKKIEIKVQLKNNIDLNRSFIKYINRKIKTVCNRVRKKENKLMKYGY